MPKTQKTPVKNKNSKRDKFSELLNEVEKCTYYTRNRTPTKTRGCQTERKIIKNDENIGPEPISEISFSKNTDNLFENSEKSDPVEYINFIYKKLFP